MEGDIELRGRLPGSTRLATGAPLSSTGAKEKSVSSLLSRKPKPGTITPLPNEDSTVVVIDSALPKRSMMETWLVPLSFARTCAPAAAAPGGSPGVAAPMSRSPISAARDAR